MFRFIQKTFQFIWTCLILENLYRLVRAVTQRNRSYVNVPSANDRLIRARTNTRSFAKELTANEIQDSTGYRSYVLCFCDPQTGALQLLDNAAPERVPNAKVTVFLHTSATRDQTKYTIYALGLSPVAIHNVVLTEQGLLPMATLDKDMERIRWKIIKILHFYGFGEAWRWNNAYAKCAATRPFGWTQLLTEHFEFRVREFPF